MLDSEQLPILIRTGMKARGMTRKDVVRAAAEFYPITYDHVREIERGRSKNPSWPVVYALSRVFGFEHLLGFGEANAPAAPSEPTTKEPGAPSEATKDLALVHGKLIARATRLIIDESRRRLKRATGEQIELWAVQAAEAFSKTGMKRLDADFIRSFLNQQ